MILNVASMKILTLNYVSQVFKPGFYCFRHQAQRQNIINLKRKQQFEHFLQYFENTFAVQKVDLCSISKASLKAGRTGEKGQES